MPKALPQIHPTQGGVRGWAIFCPACKHAHVFNSPEHPANADQPKWTYNGDAEKPTFAPSMLVFVIMPDGTQHTTCHSFVREGRIEFLGDCDHSLKGQTVDLPEFPDGYQVNGPGA